MVDYAELKNADPERWTRAAEKAGRVGRDLDQFAEDVLKQSRDLGQVWKGKDADAARQELTGHGRDYEQAQVAYLGVEKALGALAHKVTEAKKILDAAEDYAARVPAVIRPDGSVVANPPPEARRSDGWMASIRQGTQTVADELRRALELANAADREAASALARLETPDAPNADPLTALQNKPQGKDGKGPTPEEIKKWWDGLSESEQEALKNEYPGQIGNLDGVPATDRDDANRISLGESKTALDADVKKAEEELKRLQIDASEGRLNPFDPKIDAAQARLDELKSKQDAFEAIDRRINDPDKKEALLLAFDPANDGKAAIAVGNPDTADNVLTYVPGTGGGLNSAFGTDIDRADKGYDAATAADPSKSTSSIVWQGYDAPDTLPDATGPDYRREAPEALRDFQHGLRATHEGPEQSRNTVLGHSYGGSTVGTAAEKYDLKADNIVQVAAPGSGQDHGTTAKDYQGNPQVYSTRGGLDVISAAKELHGTDTNSAEYGAKVFDSGFVGHTGYWDSDSYNESVGKIVTGKGDVGEVPRADFDDYTPGPL